MLGFAPRWFTRPKTVTHPGTNLACGRVTTLIETNVLLLSQNSKPDPYPSCCNIYDIFPLDQYNNYSKFVIEIRDITAKYKLTKNLDTF